MASAKIHQLEPDRDLVEQIKDHSLPQWAERLVEDYERVGGERDRFLWNWLHLLFPEFTLSSVDVQFADRVEEAKFRASIFVVLLDDLAERRLDRVTFEEASKIPFDHQVVNYDRSGVDVDLLTFMEQVWEELDELLRAAPRWREFHDVFRFDLTQTMAAVEYSYTLNRRLEMANVDEAERHDSPNMMLFTYINVDLMHSPGFDLAELGPLRQAVHKAQRMVRIGNWITTWERELAEGDFSSGIVVSALEHGVVSTSELSEFRRTYSSDAQQQLVERITDAGVEETFLHRWEEYAEDMSEFESAIRSVDLVSFQEGMHQVMQYHLMCRGLK